MNLTLVLDMDDFKKSEDTHKTSDWLWGRGGT